MRLLNKFASKFFGKKNEKGKSSDLSSQIISATVKRFKYKIIAGVALFFIIVVAILGVVSYLLGLVQENVERIDNLLRGGCILCTTEELEQKKEEQFQTKISIIGDEFGSKVDEVVLASTVLFQGDYYEVLDAEFDEDFDSEEYRNNVKDLLDSLSTTGGEGYDGIEQEEIDLIDSATIIMVNSNVDGKYNEDSYKEALASPGFGGDDWLINGSSCVAKAATDGLDIVIDGASIIGSFVLGNPLPLLTRLVGGAATGDGNAADHINRFANTVSICQYGFIGGTYDDVLNMPDGSEKEARKKQIADEIISFAEFYKSLFPEDEDCLYTSVGTGDMTNWRQCGAAWSNKSLGSQTVCEIGCTATSMSYLIAKSGTQLTVSSFDPGVFVDNAGFTDDGALYWDSWDGIAPNFSMIEQDVPVNNSNAVSVLGEAISEPCNGNKQPYIVLYLSLGHWVAFDHIENGTVYVMDPSAKSGVGLVPLEEAHKGNSLASYNKFCANDVNFGSTGSGNSSGSAGANSSVTKYLTAMKAIADDNQHGYNMYDRDGPDYDCSSFIYYALKNAGVLPADGSAFSTATMGEVLINAGFQQLPYDKNNLQVGDIVVDNVSSVGHTVAIYSNKDGKIEEIAANANIDGKEGDSSGNEINIREFYESGHNYQYIYRLNGAVGNDLCVVDGSTVGNIIIPEEYGNGGYTVTVYTDFNWAYDQGKVYDLWAAAGSQYDDGIATYDGRYLIACTTTFGKVGDKVDFYLADGTKIPCIIADIKNQNDAGCNEWGHDNGQRVLEFEVSHVAFYQTYQSSNPGTNGWHMEWSGKRVTSATNLGENILS